MAAAIAEVEAQAAVCSKETFKPADVPAKMCALETTLLSRSLAACAARAAGALRQTGVAEHVLHMLARIVRHDTSASGSRRCALEPGGTEKHERCLTPRTVLCSDGLRFTIQSPQEIHASSVLRVHAGTLYQACVKIMLCLLCPVFGARCSAL